MAWCGRLIAGACVASLSLVASAGALGAEEPAGVSDASDDFLLGCDPAATPVAGPLAMDVVGARYLGETDGRFQFMVAVRDDIAVFFASNPESAAVVVEIWQPDGPVWSAIHEIHEGERRDVVMIDDDASVAGATVGVDIDGSVLTFDVDGVPAEAGARWSVSSFVMPDAETFLCDAAPGLEGGGLELVPAAATSSAPTTVTTPATSAVAPSTASPATTAASVAAHEDASDDVPSTPWGWVALLLGLLIAGGAAFWAWVRRVAARVDEGLDRVTEAEDRVSIARELAFDEEVGMSAFAQGSAAEAEYRKAHPDATQEELDAVRRGREEHVLDWFGMGRD